MAFSEPDPQTFTITPLGAAIVEAMPDKKIMRRIRSRFNSKNECPASAIFSREEVEQFYKQHGRQVRAV